MIQPVPIALALALAMSWVWYVSKNKGFLILAVVWCTYAVYEYLMYIRLLCAGECNIRIDLLLIYPALALGTICVSAVAIVQAIKRKFSNSRNR